MSSHKGSWNRVKDKKAWDECPLWKNKEKKKENEAINTDPDDTKPKNQVHVCTIGQDRKADRQPTS
jgi:hypothetical protein